MTLNIQILYELCILFDKFLSRLYLITHQDIEGDIHLGFIQLIHRNPKKNPLLRIPCCSDPGQPLR